MKTPLFSRFTWTPKWKQFTWVGNSEEAFVTILDQMLSSLFSFASHRSGWMLKEINGLYVKLVSYIPLRVSAFFALPSDLQSVNCLLNIRNRHDNNSFLYSYVAGWHFAYAEYFQMLAGESEHTQKHLVVLTHWHINWLAISKCRWLSTNFQRLKTWTKFKWIYSVTKKKDIIPLGISKHDSTFFLNLFPTDGQAYHCVLIKALKILVSKLKQQVVRSSTKLCHVCQTAEFYKRYIEISMRNEAATIQLTDEKRSILQFENYQSRWFASYVMYFDFDLLNKLVATCSNFW